MNNVEKEVSANRNQCQQTLILSLFLFQIQAQLQPQTQARLRFPQTPNLKCAILRPLFLLPSLSLIHI